MNEKTTKKIYPKTFDVLGNKYVANNFDEEKAIIKMIKRARGEFK